MFLEVTSGNVDYDLNEEVALCINLYEATSFLGEEEVTPLRNEFLLFDDLSKNFELLTQLSLMGTANCALADIDSDGLDEIVYAKLDGLQGRNRQYFLIALDDQPHQFRSLGFTTLDLSPDINASYVFVESPDLDGDQKAEIASKQLRLRRFLCRSLVAAKE